MASPESATSRLLALPEPCLLAVLQYCATQDQCSLFSAATAHSRLHHAAMQVLHSITMISTTQEQMNSILPFLAKHGRRVSSITLQGAEGTSLSLCTLPAKLQLDSLQLNNMSLQLQSGYDSHGVLGYPAVAALKQLRLGDCRTLDHGDAQQRVLAMSLSQLCQLEHLTLTGQSIVHFLINVEPHRLQRVQQLTYLELSGIKLDRPIDSYTDEARPPLEILKVLTRLVDLRLSNDYQDDCERGTGFIPACVLSGMQRLTRLELLHCTVERGGLVGKADLRHLKLDRCGMEGCKTATAQLLSQIQDMQQLTHLCLAGTLGSRVHARSNPPVTAYSALTASSVLQHLDISRCRLPSGVGNKCVWAHVFPAGRQLPHLRELKLSGSTQNWVSAIAPDGTRLVSCCPNLRHLDCMSLLNPYPYGEEWLVPLQELSRLHTLRASADPVQALQAVCQLTELRQLSLFCPQHTQNYWLLLQLTQLKQLTALTYRSGDKCAFWEISFTNTGAPGDKPVWCQLLQRFADGWQPWHGRLTARQHA